MNLILRPIRWFTETSLFRSLRFRLILLVLLASLPSLALLLITANQQRSVAVDTGREEAERLAGLVAENQRTVATNIETVLNVLALTSELAGQDPEACETTLSRLSYPGSQGEEPSPGGGSDFRISGATFVQATVFNESEGKFEEFCAGPAGPGIYTTGDFDLAKDALASGRVTAGNYSSSITGTMVITYAVPISATDGEGNRVNRIILARINVHALQQLTVNVELPTDTFIYVISREGILEQRYPSDSEVRIGSLLVGTPVIDQTIGRVDVDDENTEEEVVIDDIGYVVSSDTFVTQGPLGVPQVSYAVVGIPEDVVVQRGNDKFTENLGKLGIALLVALVAAWVGADLFMGSDAETRKSLIRDFYHAFSTGQVNDLDQVIGPGFIDRTAPSSQAAGIAGLRQNIAAFRTAFPDGKVIVRELLADHDKVVARVTLSGTHLAEYFGIPPSGKHMVADGVETFRFMHGMVVESWSMFGDLKQRQAPTDEPRPARVERSSMLHRIVRRRVKPANPGETR